jgi:hypothetical protein
MDFFGLESIALHQWLYSPSASSHGQDRKESGVMLVACVGKKIENL